MADQLELEVSRREGTGKEIAKKLRREGKVPAIVYGGHKESVPIVVDQKSVQDLVRKSEHGIRSIFLLKMAGSDQARHAMIKELKLDPISKKMEHIDFVRVMMDEKVKVTIPIHLNGVPVGVKVNGGVLDFQARELHVECLPGAIPDTFDVDVTGLDVHHFFRISDLTVPEGVKILDDPDRVIASVSPARAEAEPVVAAEAGPAEPEVIKKGKTESEEE
jgi:large subunit ribosomal protein L25